MKNNLRLWRSDGYRRFAHVQPLLNWRPPAGYERTHLPDVVVQTAEGPISSCGDEYSTDRQPEIWIGLKKSEVPAGKEEMSRSSWTYSAVFAPLAPYKQKGYIEHQPRPFALRPSSVSAAVNNAVCHLSPIWNVPPSGHGFDVCKQRPSRRLCWQACTEKLNPLMDWLFLIDTKVKNIQVTVWDNIVLADFGPWGACVSSAALSPRQAYIFPLAFAMAILIWLWWSCQAWEGISRLNENSPFSLMFLFLEDVFQQ